MNFGILAAGAAQGLGEGLKEVGKQWREDDIRAENQRMGIEKEKRVEEAAIRAEQRNIANSETIARKNKEIAHEYAAQDTADKVEAQKAVEQAALDVKLDPKNTEAQLKLKEAENKLEIAKQVAIDRATYHDTTDYAGRKLQNELAQLKIDEYKAGGKLTEIQKERIKSLQESIKENRNVARSILAQDSSNLIAKDMLQQASETEKELNSFFERQTGKTSETNTKPTDDFAEYSKTALNQKAKETPKETAPTTVNAPVSEQNAAGISNKEELAGEQLPYRKGMTSRGILSSKQQLDKAIRDIQKDDTLTPKQKELQIKALTKQL